MCRFAEIKLRGYRIREETTLLYAPNLLDCHWLTEASFAEVKARLANRGVRLRSGALVDPTIIDAPSSTINQTLA